MPYQPAQDPAAIPDSYWAATAPPLPAPPPFEGGHDTEVVVIGAGFTGLSTALHIAETGGHAIVVDANEPGWGASGRNNGQIVAELKHEPYEIEQRFGIERGRALLDAVGKAPDLVFDIVRRYGIDCEATRSGILTAAHSAAAAARLSKRAQLWLERGIVLEQLDRDATRQQTGSDFYYAAVRDPRGGAMNPLAYARGLARAAAANGVILFSQARARKITPSGARWRVAFDRGEIVTDKVVLATNAYTDDVWRGLRRTIIPVRTPQIVSEPLPADVVKAILPGGEIMSDTRKLIVGVRTHRDGRLHFGGGGGVPGAERQAPYRRLQAEARKLYPGLPPMRWQYCWSGFIALTSDFYPRLFELAPGVATCLGYSGRGLSMATLIGRQLSQWALGRAAIDALAFPVSPYRQIPYYDFKNILIEGSMSFYRTVEKVEHTLSSKTAAKVDRKR